MTKARSIAPKSSTATLRAFSTPDVNNSNLACLSFLTPFVNDKIFSFLIGDEIANLQAVTKKLNEMMHFKMITYYMPGNLRRMLIGYFTYEGSFIHGAHNCPHIKMSWAFNSSQLSENFFLHRDASTMTRLFSSEEEARTFLPSPEQKDENPSTRVIPGGGPHWLYPEPLYSNRPIFESAIYRVRVLRSAVTEMKLPDLKTAVSAPANQLLPFSVTIRSNFFSASKQMKAVDRKLKNLSGPHTIFSFSRADRVTTRLHGVNFLGCVKPKCKGDYSRR